MQLQRQVADLVNNDGSFVLENIYRCVNVAIINEPRLLFERMDIGVWDVTGARQTGRSGSRLLTPARGSDCEMIVRHAQTVVDTRDATAPWRTASHRVVMA